MLDNLEQELQVNLNNYKNNNTLELKNELIEKIIKIDKEYTKEYIEEIKKHIEKGIDLSSEQIRIKNIVKLMDERTENRKKINNIVEELKLEVNLDNIPNIEKRNIFSNKLKIVETILNITSKLNESNKNKAIEILNRKEFKTVLLEFAMIENHTSEAVEKYINSIIKIPINLNENSNLKILNYYHENKKIFPNLNIPNMGLIEEKKDIEIDNKSFFIN